MTLWSWIIVSAVVTGLVTTLVFTVKSNIKLQQDLNFAVGDNNSKERELEITKDALMRAEKQLSFQEGLHAGRRTDALYRQLLKKYTKDEQFTVMMNGAKDGDI